MPRSESPRSNCSSRLLGTHPLNSLPSRYNDLRLERLPNFLRNFRQYLPAQVVAVE